MTDIERFTEIEAKCFSQKYRYGSSILLGLIRTAQNNTTLTCLVDDFIAGFIVCEIDENNGKLGRIITIQVDPSFHRKKIGTYLLEAIEKNLKDFYKINVVELQVHHKNDVAIRFYIKNGYVNKRLIKNYYARREHALLMQKLI